jgi:alpha-mannosidase
LGTAEFGVALLNYARYAHDVKDSNLRLTLLRSPIEQVRSTDEGRHVIEYSLIPHKGSWQDASIMQKGYEFNVRPDIISLSEYLTPDVQLKKTSTSYFSVSTPNVMIEAIKLAYDAQNHFSIILRFFEFHGEQNPVEIISLFSVQSVTETDLLERPINSKNPIKLVNNHRIIVGFSPYEIKTLKLTIEK